MGGIPWSVCHRIPSGQGIVKTIWTFRTWQSNQWTNFFQKAKRSGLKTVTRPLIVTSESIKNLISVYQVTLWMVPILARNHTELTDPNILNFSDLRCINTQNNQLRRIQGLFCFHLLWLLLVSVARPQMSVWLQGVFYPTMRNKVDPDDEEY